MITTIGLTLMPVATRWAMGGNSKAADFGSMANIELAALTLVTAAMTIRTALARRMDHHRQWALRTFLLVNAVWFQRIGYMGWIVLNRGPVGMTSRMDGPFDIGWGFGAYLVPLAVLQAYLFAQRQPAAGPKYAVAALLLACAGLTAVGVAGAYMLMWKPYL